MCGIVGYVGSGNTADLLIRSLYRLEYRGYDSAGVAIMCDDGLKVIKSYGRILNLKHKIPSFLTATAGIGHTRWATHGKPSELNAHPHKDCTGKIAVVHNGIIENYKELKDMLEKRGHRIVSETDTEVISHLIEEFYTNDMCHAIRETAKQLKGSYAIAVVNKDYPDRVFAVRNESPLVIGIGEGQYFLASDVTGFLDHTRKAIFLEDGDMAVLSPEGISLMDMAGAPVNREITLIDWDLKATEKSGYEHYMLKEIHEQPRTLKDAYSGRINELTGEAVLGELSIDENHAKSIKGIFIIACGTSYHAGMMGKYVLEELTDIPVSIDISSEFRYGHVHIDQDTLIIALSQSGETADTIAAVKEASRKGAHIVAITNVVGSTITRESTDTIYMRTGPEIGVAATKTFTSQVLILYLLAIYLGNKRGTLNAEKASNLIRAIKGVPQKVQQVLELDKQIAEVAKYLSSSKALFLIGRHLNYPAALEGALKIKEISYILSDGFAAGELKHGPLALIMADVPVVAIATDCRTYTKTVSNILEIKARDAPVIAIASDGNLSIDKLTDMVIHVPNGCEYTSPIMSSIVLQLLAYYIALYRGCPIDKPRNLAKSVTVE
jgi:glucosamine--fructose-6-phosphate aminotransferase (isomerizing)